MDLDISRISSNRKEILKIALRDCNLSEILEDKELLASLAHCISKGTTKEIKLLNQALSASFRSSPDLPADPTPPCVISDNTALTQPGPNAIVTQQPPSLSITLRWRDVLTPHLISVALPSSPPSSTKNVALPSSSLSSTKNAALPSLPLSSDENWTEVAKATLELCVKSDKAEAIIRVVKRLRTPLVKPDPKEFWSAQDGILNRLQSSHHFTRVSRCLQEARRRTANAKYEERLLSLFYAHAIDELVRSREALGRERKGVSRLTLAFEAVAAITDAEDSKVRTEYRAGKKYKQLIAKGGSASIFQLDIEDESTWNYKIRLPDIDLICTLRNRFRPQLEEESRQLGKDSCEIIIQGVLACGCTLENTELKQILDKEEGQESITISLENDPCPAKRLRGIENEEFAPVQEFDINQLEPSSKRQRQSNFLDCDSNQSSRGTQPVLEVPTAMNNPTTHSPEANNEAPVPREAPNISLDGNIKDSRVPDDDEDMSEAEDFFALNFDYAKWASAIESS